MGTPRCSHMEAPAQGISFTGAPLKKKSLKDRQINKHEQTSKQRNSLTGALEQGGEGPGLEVLVNICRGEMLQPSTEPLGTHSSAPFSP